MKIPFFKCNGNGNSFIILVQNSSFKRNYTKTKIQEFCTVNNDKVDGCIIVNYTNEKIEANYYNNDGSWETFCLNGLKCVALIMEKILNKKEINVTMNNINYKTSIDFDSFISIKLDEPIYKMKNIRVNNVAGDYIDSGAKHFVCNYNESWDMINIVKQMEDIRFDDLFKPKGINVNYYKIINNRCIEVKTYEKGIEKIMDSCASGSYACAYDYSVKNDIFGKIKVINDGGISQIIFNDSYKKNLFKSKAEIESKGEIEI